MSTQEILDPQQWAETTFGQARLQDRRRTRRTVVAAAHMAKDPAASLPAQAQTWKEIKAVYRLLDEPDVTRSGADATPLATDLPADGAPAPGFARPGYDRPGFEPSRQDERLGRDRRWERTRGIPANHPGSLAGRVG